MEEKIRMTIIDELLRQADTSPELKIIIDGNQLIIHGPVDLDVLVAAIVGSVAGGP